MIKNDSLSLTTEYQQLSDSLRRLLDAELAAGNAVVEIFHSFPAPPTGACFRLAKPLVSGALDACGELTRFQRNSSLCSGEITDERRLFYLIEPPIAVDLPQQRQESIDKFIPGPSTAAGVDNDRLVDKFKESMVMNFEKWHDGIGYDVALIERMNAEEKEEVQSMILAKSQLDWFDIEALALLDLPASRARLSHALNDASFTVRNAVQRFAPNLVNHSARTDSLVAALRETTLFAGLSQALDEVVEYHPPEVIDALIDCVRNRDGEVASLMAALLLYLHGVTQEPYDMEERPFFLRFNTDDLEERTSAWEELSRRIGRKS